MKKTCISAMLLFSCFFARGQCIISSCGGELSQENASVCISVGEVFTDQFSTSEIHLSPGVTAPASESDLTAISSIKTTAVQVYYDLSSSSASIKMEEAPSDAFYEIYTVSGKLVLKNEIKESESIISLQNQTTGIYLLKINTGNEIKTVKLIKK